MKKLIKLLPPSAVDAICCPDGELEGSAFLFGSSEAAGSGARPELALSSPSWSVPAGQLWLAMHKPVGAPGPHPVFVDPSMLPVAGGGAPKGVTIGDWLVLHPAVGTHGRLLFARWNGSGYDWWGVCPSAPQVTLRTPPKALPPYCIVDGDLPRFSLSAPAGTDFGPLVQKAKAEFLAAVAAAGLHFDPVIAAAAWRLADGTLWLRSEPQRVGPDDAVSLRTVSSNTANGVSYITVEVSRAPFAVELASAAGLPAPWDSLAATRELLVAGVGEPLPEAAGSIAEAGDIYAIGGRLFAVLADGVTVSFAASVPGVPFASAGTGASGSFSAPSLLNLAGSLRSGGFSSSQQLPPLFAFCGDGIHQLNPGSGGGYRDVRLLSRHVPLSRSGFAPLPDGTAFVAASGVVKVTSSGVSAVPVSSLSLPPALPLGEDTRLIYLASVNGLAVLPPEFTDRHYAWPDLYLRQGSRIAKAAVSYGSAAGMSRDSSLIPIATRPLKLTDAFSLKRLEEVHALWPDGSCPGFRVYGAMNLSADPLTGEDNTLWRFLGSAPKGRMLLRGSSWRFFRILSFAISTPAGYSLPHFFINFASPSSRN